MKKISILSLHLGFGGVEKSVVALANLLCKTYDVEIACSYKLYDKSVFELDKRVKVKYLISNYKPNREEFLKEFKNKKIKGIIKEGKYAVKVLKLRKKTMVNYIKNTDSDVIISTKDIFDEYLGNFAKENVLKIGWEHNHYHDNLKYADTVTRASKNLDYLVLVSNQLTMFYKERLRKYGVKCIHIPNILDYIPKKKSKLDEKRIVSVGRLSPEKGYMDLLKIFNKISNKYPDWHLDIVGDGVEKEKLLKYINDNNLEKNIILHGFRKKDYIDKLFLKSSIYVMTSYTESFGIVLIEAMSYGLPVIAYSSAEGALELIDSGSNGYLIKHRNEEAMIKKISDLIEKKEEREKIAKNGLESVKKYAGDEVVKTWIDIIEGKK